MQDQNNWFQFLFELYNLPSEIRRSREQLDLVKLDASKLKSHVQGKYKESFMSTKRMHNGDVDGGNASKRNRANSDRLGGQGGESGRNQQGTRVSDAWELSEEFDVAGYMLESSDEDENGWEPLNKVNTIEHYGILRNVDLTNFMQLKPTMRHAVQSGGTAVVLKLLHPNSNELACLQFLSSLTSAYNHTIPLLDSFNLNMQTFIALPEATPLDFGFKIRPAEFCARAEDFGLQLIDGIAFLHYHGVAHLDIKPQNIVVDGKSLCIIDFETSVRVRGPDDLIDDWCGTPGWMAPEIGTWDEPRRLYSPIQADLWSCGLVLLWLAFRGCKAGHNSSFVPLANKLVNTNPSLRPMLSYGADGTTLGRGECRWICPAV
jgi:hypothetical protein